MRKALLVVPILVAQGLLAQEPPPAQNLPEEPAANQARPQATPAPKLGHPLDPGDVDILTGKARGSAKLGFRGEVSPYGYGGYPVNVAQYSPSQFARFSNATSPPFVPLLFGRVGNRSFFLIGNTTSFAPPLFFFSRGRGLGSNLLFAPAASPGFSSRRR